MEDYLPKPKYFNRGYEPIIGRSCSLTNTLLDCSAQITIGDCVSFGHDVLLLTGKHDYVNLMEKRQEISICEPIIIKDGAWIASGVIVCGGVTIGKNAVVGAGSIVTHDIPDNEMWIGQPARYHKTI